MIVELAKLPGVRGTRDYYTLKSTVERVQSALKMANNRTKAWAGQ